MIKSSQSFKQPFVAISAILFLSLLSYGHPFSLAAQQERTYKIYEPNWPKGLLEIKQVNNLQSPSFPKDFEVEVKNISNKPIYAIFIGVIVPESKGSTPLTFDLDNGRQELIHSHQWAM